MYDRQELYQRQGWQQGLRERELGRAGPSWAELSCADAVAVAMRAEGPQRHPVEIKPMALADIWHMPGRKEKSQE